MTRRWHCGGCGATVARLAVDPHGEANTCPGYDLRDVPQSDPVRDALVLAAGEIRALFAWGDRVGPSGWAHVRQNFDGLREAVDNALDAIDARGIK